jgi:2-aminobenzoate-CoA ligase
MAETRTQPAATAHVDDFCDRNLPPRELWPQVVFDLPELQYPERLNAATELLDKAVERGWGDRTVFHFNGSTWTYRQLLERANQIAHVLVEELKLVPGNRVLLRAPNCPMLAACWFAVLKAGGVVVCTMPLLRARELEPIIDQAEIDLALSDSRNTAVLESAMARRQLGVMRFHGDGVNSLEGSMRTKSRDFTNCETAAEDIAIIAFTSGTTGRSKGTMHSHRDLLAACDCFPKHVLKASPEDVFVGSPPLAFTYALGGLLLFPMRIGASTLLLEQAQPAQLLEAIHKHEPTVCFTSPTGYRAMLPKLSDFSVKSLRKCVSAGEHLPRATFEAWERATGIRIIDGIGSTEMLHIFISSPEPEARAGSTGRVVPGYRACIVDDEGKKLEHGKIGRLAVIGPTG